MASGDTLITLTPLDNTPPAANFATFDTMTGASTPAESIPVLDFDDTTQEYADFYCVMPASYAGGGVTVTVVWSCADHDEGTPHVVAWQAAFRRVADDAEDLDTTAHTYDFNEVIATVPSVAGEVAYDNITFTNGADMDSVSAEEYFIIRVTRDPTPSSGTDATGDASIHAVVISET
jgi:hypothetical protein